MAEPLTLHFNVFQAGSPPEPKRSVTVDDPGSLTVLSLKEEYFGQALEEQKGVRFITGGKILDDKAMLSSYNLGKEASIMVSISSGTVGKTASTGSSGGVTVSASRSHSGSDAFAGSKSSEDPAITVWFVVGSVLFAGTAAGLHWAYTKRLQFSMQTNQFVFISVAVWAYAMLFHGLPGLWRVAVRLLCRSGGQAPAAPVSPSRRHAPAPAPEVSSLAPTALSAASSVSTSSAAGSASMSAASSPAVASTASVPAKEASSIAAPAAAAPAVASSSAATTLPAAATTAAAAATTAAAAATTAAAAAAAAGAAVGVTATHGATRAALGATFEA
eukprot:TRINITY_DN47893_c0_g2_i1.p1 TRINITY_DN47893_c0_g2~~TRINITY_DN47893_c0_g2_i1.p1  ORF type:complete len:331 (+),score=81.14 TRINITY_DN47893_c0_g2_i1:62-1054(+)